MTRKRLLWFIAAAALLVGLRVYRGKLVRTIAEKNRSVAAVYVFDGGKTVRAVFHSGGKPRVELTLGDGRKLTLSQTLSASGARYASLDGSTMFWIKGDTAVMEENGKTTYANGKQILDENRRQ